MQKSKLSQERKSAKRFTIRELWVVWYAYAGLRIPYILLALDGEWAIRFFRLTGLAYDDILQVEKYSPNKQYRSCLLTKADIRPTGSGDH